MTTATDKPRIVQMDSDSYHADSSAWSRSMLMDFRERRSICYARHVLGTAPAEKPSKAMDVGDLAHAALLEPHRLDTDYVVYPKELLAKNGAVSTNAAKEFRDSHNAAGHVVVKQEDFDVVAKMVQSVKSKFGHWLKEGGLVENAIYWTDEMSGIPCKIRPDFLVKTYVPVVLDIKSTGDVSPDQFRRRVESLGHWLQDAHYSAGVRELYGADPVFVFIVVESSWPYQCAAYELTRDDKRLSEEVRRELLTEIGCCYESGIWADEWEGIVNPLKLHPKTYER